MSAPLRVLVVHNRYREAGGEDAVFANEVALLRSGGVEVETLESSNAAIGGFAGKAAAALAASYSRSGKRAAARAIARLRPDVVHVHNAFPWPGPALFDACAEAGVPAVWTLHNFRLACANGLLFRDGRPCEDCLGRAPWPAVAHRCYRGSLAGSAAVAASIAWHRARGTWRSKVARFVVLSEFARALTERAGVPAERIAVKPNFVADPGLPEHPRSGALYVGRLSREKGVATLVEAWRQLPQVPLTVIGDGPERAALEAAAPKQVRFLGARPKVDVLAVMAEAQALVLPSEWYENFPMVLVEAMALGTPVIAARIGALAALVEPGANGLHFTPGDPADLARVADETFADPARLAKLGAGARAAWRARLSPESNLEQLLEIYREAGAR